MWAGRIPEANVPDHASRREDQVGAERQVVRGALTDGLQQPIPLAGRGAIGDEENVDVLAEALDELLRLRQAGTAFEDGERAVKRCRNAAQQLHDPEVLVHERGRYARGFARPADQSRQYHGRMAPKQTEGPYAAMVDDPDGNVALITAG